MMIDDDGWFFVVCEHNVNMIMFEVQLDALPVIFLLRFLSKKSESNSAYSRQDLIQDKNPDLE